MCRRLICVLSFVLVSSICSDIAHGQAGLIGFWKFDESSGMMASDSSGSGNNGTLANGVAWRPGEGMGGGALFVNPADASGYCEISTAGMKVSEGTLMVWGKLTDPQPARTSYFMGHTTQPVWTNRIQFYTNSGNNLLNLGLGDTHTRQTGIVDLALETWYHIALTWDAGAYVVYVNGEDTTRGTYTGLTALYPIMDIGNDGHDQRTREEAFGGLLDEMKIFDRALTAEEIQQAMRIIPPGVASKPNPANEVIDVPPDVVLSWTPGAYAPPVNGHKVYLSESFNDVNDGVGGIAVDANSYDPGRLNFGTTYYWRVDEVNGPPDYTVYEGSVWQFTTEPVGYPIENVTATASSMQNTDTGPENTVNGSGLDDNDLHSKDESAMWLSSIAGPQPTWIQYEFDKVYKLYQLLVWNSNQAVEPMVGFGIKDVTIEYSVNGTDYTTLGTTQEFAQAPGTPGYAYNTTIDFGGIGAKYVRLTANSNWGGILNQYGLSEVRFLYIPVHAREPYPDSGATDVDVDVTLGFRAGREAAQHDVYLSSDQQAVIDGTVSASTVTETSHGPLSLNLAQTYYWKINEVNTAETPTTWEGDLWNFTTQEYFVVDDFESYNNLDPTDSESNRIFNAWIDGYQVPTNGSLVGYENPPFTEQTIVHGGKQSMPFFFSNTGGAANSEAERTFAAQDWTQNVIKTLSLWFYGDPDNTSAQMYVKINGTKVAYDGDARNLTAAVWQPWNIDLASSGAGLQNVTKLAIGIDGNGASGKLLFDDIRLYPYDRQLTTPTDPGSTGLVAHYNFDQNTSDVSGNGHNGTIEGLATLTSPGWDGTGSCMQFGGDTDRVTVESFDLTGSGITLSAWIKPGQFKNDARMISKSEASATSGHYWAMVLSGSNEDNLQFRLRTDVGATTSRTSSGSPLTAGEWTHVAVTWDASDPYMRMYKNGREIDIVSKDGTAVATGPGVKIGIGNQSVSAGPAPADMTRPFDGLIDEVRVYDRAVSVAEMAWLAGRTKPFDKPF